MARETLEQQMRNSYALFIETAAEQAVSDNEKFNDLVRRETLTGAAILRLQSQNRPVPQELRDEHNRLTDLLWRVDEIEQGRQN